MITLKLNFIKTNPSGNTTILIDSIVPEQDQSAVAKRLLAYDSVQAEQVGFLTHPEASADYTIAMRMMGGEFCGNATRSAAVYTVFAGLLQPSVDGIYTPIIRCSGAAHPIPCTVKETNQEATYWAEAQMPGPLAIQNDTVSFLGDTINYTKVIFEGITHCIIKYKDLPLGGNGAPISLRTIYAIVKDDLFNGEAAAYGLMFYNELQKTLDPVVYVKATDSTYWEQSCASGSSAIAAAHAWANYGDKATADGRNGKPIANPLTLTLSQPGGPLHMRIVPTETGCQYFLSGIINIAAIGEAYL